MIFAAFVYIYSVFILAIIPIIKVIATKNEHLKKQLEGRSLSIKPSPSKKFNKSCIFFFCSSAGEFEQAKPIIDRLTEKSKNTKIVIFFYSRSGLEFIKARKYNQDENLEFILCPPDSVFHWKPYFNFFRPSHVFIVRHELWPAFIYLAKRKSNLIIFDVDSKPMAFFKKVFKINLLNQAQKIYTIDKKSQKELISGGLSPKKVENIGDTKFDQVVIRAEKVVASTPQFLNLFSASKTKIIIGSAWLADVHACTPAFAEILRMGKDNVQLIIVPHDISEKMIQSITQVLKTHNLEFDLFSSNLNWYDQDVVIVDKMGVLSELYAICQLAIVGGAFHHRVHNVLEPACFAIPIAFGPRYKTSPEARTLVKNQLAEVLNNERDVLSWLTRHIRKKLYKNLALKQHLDKLSGATKHITNTHLKDYMC